MYSGRRDIELDLQHA